MLNNNSFSYPNEELIPYACYLDRSIILTKNCDLLTTIKIPSLITNRSKTDLFDIRETLRLILMANYKYQNISFYFTTIRKKADIIPNEKTKNYFGQKISNIWNEQNNWYNQYVNEIYITIIASPDLNDSLLNPLYFIQTLTQTGVNSIFAKKIEKNKVLLKKLTKIFVEKLSEYDAQLLSIVENNSGIFYSEHMSFFSQLINLDEGAFPITYDNISDIIRQKKIRYEYDTIELSDKKNEKQKFASILTLKSFQNLSLTQLDKIIQLPMELIITETCSFTDNKYAEHLFKESQDMIALSEDMDLAYFSNLDTLVSHNSGKNTDFCLGQTSIMITENTKEGLIDKLKTLYNSFDLIGLVGVKENIFLPTIFWSQLPGNFRYLKRFNLIPSNYLANYVSLFNFPIGKLKYNYWGSAITIIPTALKTPYFFNFHNGYVGNTLIVGLKETGKTTIMNFLISQTTSINPKIFYIDTKRNSEVFINAMGGKYFKISPNLDENEQLNLNPFMVENTPENETFLIDLIKQLVDFQDDGFIEMGQEKTQLKSQYKQIPNIIKQILSLPMEERTFEKALEKFNTAETKLIYNKFSLWKNEYSFVFNHSKLEEFNEHIIGISLKTIINNKNITTPIVYCLFQMIQKLADNKPFIFAIDDAWEIVDNPKIAPLFLDMLKNGPKKNIATIVTTDGLSKFSESSITDPIVPIFATEIYLANPKINLYYKKVFLLKEDESKILSLMKLEERNFLLKCINDIVISSINLKNFNFYKKIFSNDNISINAMKKAKEMSGNEPEKWIPKFLELLDDYDKIMAAKKLKETEMNQIRWEESKADENNQNKILKEE